MTTKASVSPESPQKAVSGSVIVGPWPIYASFKTLAERERWTIYELAKSGRAAMEDKGFVMGETYDQFIVRVAEELDL